jgi:hypothetical protein
MTAKDLDRLIGVVKREQSRNRNREKDRSARRKAEAFHRKQIAAAEGLQLTERQIRSIPEGTASEMRSAAQGMAERG